MGKVEGSPINFLVDTGAEFSVLKHPLGKLKNKKTWVMGATGHKPYAWTTACTVDLGKGQVTHSFLVIPECPLPLLGKDLLTKLKAQIKFSEKGPQVEWTTPDTMILALRLEEEYRLHEDPSPKVPMPDFQQWMNGFPLAWAEIGGMGMAERVPPVVVGLKAGASPIGVCQYSE